MDRRSSQQDNSEESTKDFSQTLADAMSKTPSNEASEAEAEKVPEKEDEDGPEAPPDTPNMAVVQHPSRLRSQIEKKKEKKRQKDLADLKKVAEKHGLQGKDAEEAAENILKRKEYNEAPLGVKIQRLENMIVGATQGLGQEVQKLQHNDFELADAMDINFKALGKALSFLGITPEKQSEFLKQAQEDIVAERKAMAEANAAQKSVQMPSIPPADAAALQAVAEVAEQKSVEKEIDKSGETPPEPEAATVFGG